MTNAEAIAMLKRMQEPEAWEPQINVAAFEALNMAIEALGKDTDVHSADDLISRQAAIDEIDEWIKAFLENGHKASAAAACLIQDGIIQLPSAGPEIIRCKDCKHKPYPSDNYDYNNGACGFEIIFPDYRCPCRCDDEYYNRIPDDDWFCGNAERRTDAADRC